jgi:hemolysin type calcium-binding protein/LVIVD repeat-containing protein
LHPRTRLLILPAALVLAVAMSLPSSADHGTRPIVGPLTVVGDSPNPANSDLTATGKINTDLAFWGDTVYEGTWDGFRAIDVSDPAAPVELVKFEGCVPGNQGDVIVWGTPGEAEADLLIRSWNSNTPLAGGTCDGDPVPAGFEGIHIFDISDITDPDLIGSVDTPGGSHTATLVPDLANDRLLVYNSPSGGNGIEIIQIPLTDPSTSTLLRIEPAIGSCHDTQVFLGDVLRAVCAGGSGHTMWSMDPADGGSLTNPIEMFSSVGNGTGLSHSAAFTWDGRMYAIGHEPGGGTDDRCDEGDRELERTQFFYDTQTGQLLGRWVMNPPQTEVVENCTIHNYNFIPTLNGRDIIVGGHYQAGTWVVDVTDPQRPEVIARADPPPLDENQLVVGGAWSSYWYDGLIYESEITKGLHIFGLDHPDADPGAFRPEAFSNPQTQMESIRGPDCRGVDATLWGTEAGETLFGTTGEDVLAGLGGDDEILGAEGNDVICAGDGHDTAAGGAGDDELFGQSGRDDLRGGLGEDRCAGGTGRDTSRSCEIRTSIP